MKELSWSTIPIRLLRDGPEFKKTYRTGFTRADHCHCGPRDWTPACSRERRRCERLLIPTKFFKLNSTARLPTSRFTEDHGAGDEARTRNFQLGNVILLVEGNLHDVGAPCD